MSSIQGFIAIPKSSQKKRIKSNVEVFDFHLSEQEIEDLDRLDECQSPLIFFNMKLIVLNDYGPYRSDN